MTKDFGICRICKIEKSKNDFYAGRRICKKCIKIRSNNWIKSNHDKRNLIVRKYRQNGNNTYLNICKNSRQRHHETRLQVERAWKKNNPEKCEAHNIVARYKNENDVTIPCYCQLCKKDYDPKLIIAHHEDYSKPLDVIFICRSCHNLIHLGEIDISTL